MPSISSGLVSNLTNTTFFFASALILASAELKTISPVAAPGEALSPLPSFLAFANAFSVI